ncbi:MAG TPA: hypothetical protein VFQ63_02330 [Patescibacteria group bacterium]|nr:hypothetical protein [Patescibacteria group bacterium]
MVVAEAPIRYEQKTGYKREFRLDIYDPTVSEQRLRKDIDSYLGEYRFKVREYRFNLHYKANDAGEFRLRSDDGQSMVEVGEAAIADRQQGGGSLYKVSADLNGVKRQEELLAAAEDGDVIMYGSPPDKQAGYTYGFVYVGRVEKTWKGKVLHTRAIRVPDGTTLEQFNQALSAFTKEQVAYETPNSFIEHPELISGDYDDATIDAVLQNAFAFGVSEAERHTFALMQQDPNLQGLVDQFIQLVRDDASFDEKAALFDIIENYAEETWKEYLERGEEMPERREQRSMQLAPREQMSIGALKDRYGYTPTQVSGTCPNENDRTSADIFGVGSLFEPVLKKLGLTKDEEKSGFECPNCHVGWVVGDKCPNCKITAKEWGDKNPDKKCA